MPKSRKNSSTIVLSRYFDKNVQLVAGVCSKCYLEGEDDIKVIAVNRKFLKEVEKRNKLKHTTFLHDDYPCEGDYISRQTSENNSLKLPPTTFTNDDYALITTDTSRSRQMKPRVNCCNSNSACGNEATTLCTKMEDSLNSKEKVDNKNYYYRDNIKTETNGNFPTENISSIQYNSHDANILHNRNDLSPFLVESNSTIATNPIVLDTFKIRENSNNLNLNNSDELNIQNCIFMQICSDTNINNSSNNLDNRKVANNLTTSQNKLYNHDYVRIDSFEKMSEDIQNTSSNQRTNIESYANSSNLINNSNIQNNSNTDSTLQDNLNNTIDMKFCLYSENNCLNGQTDSNFKSSSNDYNNLKPQNSLIVQNHENDTNDFRSKDNLDILKRPNDKINLSKLGKYNSQASKWLLISKNTDIKTETIDVNNTDNNDSKTIPNLKIQIKTESIKTEDEGTPRAINFAKLKIKMKPNIQKPIWIPPRSPHNLIEESLFHDPWSLLIATIFLNKTSCMCARPRVEEFLRDFSGPLDVLKEQPTQLEKYFLDLGLYKKRAEQVWRMSYDYAYKNWRNPKELYGIGKYGEDAYRMFVLGDLDIEPTDRFLRIYRDWAKMKQKEEMNAKYPDDY